MQSVSDDDARKRLVKKPRFELVYSDWEDVTSSGRAFLVFGPAAGKAQLPVGRSAFPVAGLQTRIA